MPVRVCTPPRRARSRSHGPNPGRGPGPWTRAALLCALAPAAPWTGAADLAAQEPPRAAATRVEAPPVVDGVLGDAAWDEAPILDGFVQREPSEGRAVSQRTEVRLLHDGQSFYIGAWLYDDRPSEVVVGQTLRDASLDESDAFVVVLDTYRDRQNGFLFGTTPAGIEYDGQISNEGQGGGAASVRQQAGSGGGFNLNWDGSWEVATTTDGRGWFVEMRIPFSTLRYGSGGPQTWGVNFERRIRRNSEQSTWAAIPRQFDLYRVSMAGSLDLDAPANRILTVSPYVLTRGFRDERAVSPDTDIGTEVGGDAKIGVSPSLTLDLTLNTDFAQAEVDDQQVNLTRYSLFFPEKRAFFLENAGTFAVGTPQAAELFFSRRIGLSAGQEVPIHAGTRLTGRVGGVQIGLLDIQTGDLEARDPLTGELRPLASADNFGVARAYRELGDRTRVGAIAVSRINTSDPSDHNLTFGADGRLGVGQALTLDGWFGLTATPDDAPAVVDGSGFNRGEYGLEGAARYITRDWEVQGGYRQIGDAFNPEVGFLNRRAYRHANGRILRHVRTDDVSWFREFRPHVSWNQFWSLAGFMESYLLHFDNHFAFENGAFFQLPGLNFTGEGLESPFEISEGVVIPPGTYHNAEWSFRANTDQSAALSLSAGWTLGGFFSGHRFSPDAEVSYRFQDRLVAGLRLNYNDVHLDQGDFTASVVGLDVAYSFTPRLYLRGTVQYNDASEDVGTNVRLGWLDTAGTGLFVVYDDSRHVGTLARTGFAAGPKQRQLVVKYSRMFDLAR